MKFNSTSFSKIYYGDKPIRKVYVDNTLIYPVSLIYDLENTTFVTESVNLSTLSGTTVSPTGCQCSDNEQYYYMMNDNDQVHQFEMNTPGDLSDLTYGIKAYI